MFKIASWNVNSIKVRLPHLLQWLEKEKPDVLAIQETKSMDANFPKEAIEAAGYQVIFSGQKTYNGMAVLSKTPATEIVTELPGMNDPQKRVLGATINGVRVLNLYVPNGQAVSSDKYAYKLEWLSHLKTYIAQQLQRHKYFVALGDFNIAPEDRDVHDPKAWEGQILFSDPEKKAFKDLLKTGLSDSFRLFDQAEAAFSWWDYRQGAFRRNHGLRIDHILVNEALAKKCLSSRIDIDPRREERPSDHAPVLAEFDYTSRQ